MGVAVDANGNVFVTDGNLAGVPSSMPSVFEIMAVNGSIPPSPNIVTLYTGVLYPMALPSTLAATSTLPIPSTTPCTKCLR